MPEIALNPPLSTPSGGKATRARSTRSSPSPVSIHAFRGEGDRGRHHPRLARCVSIHAFGGKATAVVRMSVVRCGRFQSTPSGGKATEGVIIRGLLDAFQSTPSGGKATRSMLPLYCFRTFQSTPSGGKATDGHRIERRPAAVSIHAFRGEGDAASKISAIEGALFQSTPSGGKATAIFMT